MAVIAQYNILSILPSPTQNKYHISAYHLLWVCNLRQSKYLRDIKKPDEN